MRVIPQQPRFHHPLARRSTSTGRLMASIFAMGLLAAFHASADELIQRQVLGGVDIALTVRTLNGGPAASEGGAASNPGPHRLTVTLTHRSTDIPVAGARVSANVAEEGFAGTDYPLVPAAGGEPGVYEAEVPMPGRMRYRILLQVQVSGEPRMREAVFRYTHHH